MLFNVFCCNFFAECQVIVVMSQHACFALFGWCLYLLLRIFLPKTTGESPVSADLSESFSKLQQRSPSGEQTCKGRWIKMYSPSCFAKSLSQISDIHTGLPPTTSQRIWQLLSETGHQGLSREKGLGGLEFLSRSRQSRILAERCLSSTWERKALCGAPFPAHARVMVREQRADEHPASLTTLWQLLSALWCNRKWHISHG